MRRTVWRRGLVVGSAAAVLALASLTPPGAAVADWVGRLVGIGQVGGPPTLHYRMPTVRVPGMRIGQHSRRIVIATRKAPDGTPFELTTFKGARGARCITVDLPGRGTASVRCSQRSLGQATIQTGSAGYVLVWVGGGKGAYVNKSPQTAQPLTWVTGRISPQVAAVALRYQDTSGAERTSQAFATQIRGRLLHLIGARNPFGVFAGFLPQNVSAVGKVEAVAYDGQGSVIGQSPAPLNEERQSKPPGA
jgi:hypothetical protein